MYSTVLTRIIITLVKFSIILNLRLLRAFTTVRFRAMSEFVCLEPVPSDIQISQSVQPMNIAAIAEKSGIRTEEYELYGTTKAKVIISHFYSSL